jgi:hypothetical protein
VTLVPLSNVSSALARRAIAGRIPCPAGLVARRNGPTGSRVLMDDACRYAGLDGHVRIGVTMTGS